MLRVQQIPTHRQNRHAGDAEQRNALRMRFCPGLLRPHLLPPTRARAEVRPRHVGTVAAAPRARSEGAVPFQTQAEPQPFK
eukprot:7116365-Alexandrium_andersonii.AAC.1